MCHERDLPRRTCMSSSHLRCLWTFQNEKHFSKMASSSIQIDSKQPEEYEIDELGSCSTYVLRKAIVEIQPNENTTYAYNTNQFIRFNISSNSDVWIAPESYLRFEYQVAFTSPTDTQFNYNLYNLTNYANAFPSISFPRQGPISLFRSVELRALSSGVTIFRVQSQHQAYSFPFFANPKNSLQNAAFHQGISPVTHEHQPLHGPIVPASTTSGYNSGTSNPVFDKMIVCSTASLTGLAYIAALASGANYYMDCLMIIQNDTALTLWDNSTPTGVWYNSNQYRSLLQPGDTVLSTTFPNTTHNILINTGSATPKTSTYQNASTITLVITGYIYGSVSGQGKWPNATTGGAYTGAPSSSYWDTKYNYGTNIIGYSIQGINLKANATGSQTANYPYIAMNNWSYVKNNVKPSIGQVLNDGNLHTVTMGWPWAVMSHNWPLFLIKGGLQLVLELDDPNRALISGIDPGKWSSTTFTIGTDLSGNAYNVNPVYSQGTACTMTYTITVPRVMGCMSTPEPSQMRNYINRWNSDAGIVYYCPSIKIQKISVVGSETDSFLRFNLGVRSARGCWIGITSAHYSENSDALTACVDSFSIWLKTSLQYYQVQVGSHMFPLRRLQCDDLGLEAFYYWRSIVACYTAYTSHNIEPYEWMSQDYVYNTLYSNNKLFDSTKFVVSIDFSRSNRKNSLLCGIDLSIVPLDVIFNRSQSVTAEGLPTDVATVYVCAVEYDSFVRLSSQQISLLQ